MPGIIRPVRHAGMMLLLAMTLAACHLNLVAPYDEQFVKDAVTVQTDFDTLAQTLRNPPSGTSVAYDANKAGYNKVAVDLNGLQTRAMAHTNNDRMVESVTKITTVVKEMESNHKRNGTISAAYLDDKQAIIDQQIAILIRTETDKKALN